MRAGQLRHRVTFQSKVMTQDPVTGAMVESWVSAGQAWASIEPLSARDLIAAKAGQSEMTARIKIRYRAVAPTGRLLYRSQLYQILGVLPDPKSGLDYITLAASTGVQHV